MSPFENSQPSAISPNTPNTPGADAFGDVPDQKGSKRASLCGVGKKVCLVDVDHTDGPRLWRGVLPCAGDTLIVPMNGTAFPLNGQGPDKVRPRTFTGLRTDQVRGRYLCIYGGDSLSGCRTCHKRKLKFNLAFYHPCTVSFYGKSCKGVTFFFSTRVSPPPRNEGLVTWGR